MVLSISNGTGWKWNVRGPFAAHNVREKLGQKCADALKVEVLANRLCLLESIASWCQFKRHGTRRDFALHTGEHTKSMGAEDWKWLEKSLDLEALRITHFILVVWLAGSVRLRWCSGCRAARLAPCSEPLSTCCAWRRLQ